MSRFLATYGRAVEIAMVHALFTLSAFASLSSGLLSVAPVPFAAVAGFGAAAMATGAELPFEVLLILGAGLGALTAYLFSFPLLRLSSHWVAMATIALLLVSRVLVLNLTPITGGALGKQFPRIMDTWHIVVALGALAWMFSRLRRSRLGLATEAVRSHPTVAGSLGISVVGTRRIAFVLSGTIAGLGGVLLGNLLQFLGPTTYYTNLTFLMLSAVVLGGRFHWLGAIVGAVVFTAIPEIMRAFLDYGHDIANGIALILIIIFMPGGLIEPGRRERRQGAREAQRLTELEEAEPTDAEAPGEQWTEMAAADLGRRVQDRERGDGPFTLEVRNLTKTFGGLTAIDDLTFAVPEGAIFGLLGPNGAGKTTLLNLVSGLDMPDSGTILVDGQDVTRLPPHQRAPLGLARTFQDVRLFEGLTVLENIMVGEHLQRSSRAWQAVLALPRERKERQDAEERARALMERVGVIGRPDQYAGTLSYANQRRVEIARALAANPKVLMLDEPTAGMHRLGSVAVGELLLELQAQGLTLLVIEHNMQLVLDFCERAVVMDFGKLLAEGPPEYCLSRQEVKEAYFGRQADADRLESLIKLRKH